MGVDSHEPLRDAAARRRAATDFGTNLVVLAGAGTGKTSLLVERMLNAIGSGVAGIESIAAITFTEKAAGEMRERLAGGLERLRALAAEGGDVDEGEEADRAFRWLAGEADVASARIAARALAAMERLDQASVTTIHGFCAELLRARPFEAGVDPGFAIDSGEWSTSLAEERWSDFLRRELGPEARRSAEWRRLLEATSLADLGEAARGLAGFGVPGELLGPEGASVGRELVDVEARRVLDAVEQRLAREGDLTKTARQCFEGFRSALAALLDGGFSACRAAIETHDDLAARLDGKKAGFGSAPKRAGESVAAEVKRVTDEARLLCKALRGTDDEAIGRLLERVRPFVDEFRESYLRRGFVDFDGLLALTRDLLRDEPDIRETVKRRFRLLLVDEFQDTDPLQYEIVLFLAERSGSRATRAHEARLEPGRLFVVGDPKQSIYRFRGADYAAYRTAIERILAEGGESLHLVGNFRSVPGIVEPVNDLFASVDGCWRESPYQPAYEPIAAARSGTGGAPAVELWTVESPERLRAEARRAAEGGIVADAIADWHAAGLDYRRVTVLFRALTGVTPYLRALHRKGIPFVVDGGRDFLERPEVAQLIATLRALGRPADQPSLLAFLRSPAGAVSDVELARYASTGGSWNREARPSAERFPRIARAFDTLRRLAAEMRDSTVDVLVRRVLDETQLLPLGAAAFEGPQRVANLQKLAAAACALARDGSLSLGEVIDALEQARLKELETDRPLADDAAEAVRITNMHRMKGLENDFVIVPDLARQKHRGRADRVALDVPSLPGGDRALAVRVGDLRNSARVWSDLEDRRHEQAEEVRVLYVALTRARERLVLINGDPRPGDVTRALAAWGYDPTRAPADGATMHGGRVRHRRVEPPSRREPAEEPPPETAARAVRDYERAVATLQATAHAPFVAPSGLGDRSVADRGAPQEEPADVAARDRGKAVGLVLHRLLEHWDGAERKGADEALERLSREAARELSLDATCVEQEARAILDAFCASPLGARFAGVERLGAELPVLLRGETDGPGYRGKIDLLYRDETGEIVVADYKTDLETDEATLAEKYASQLGVYAEAVRQAFALPAPPRTELWLLRTGETLVLDAPPPGTSA